MFLALLFAAPSAALADAAPTTTVVPEITCDAPAGKYDKHDIPVGEILRGHFRLLAQAPHPRWAPAAGLLFGLPGENRHAGIQVYVTSADPNRFTIALKKPGDTYLPFAHASLGSVVELIVQFTNGKLTVWAEGKTKSARLPDEAAKDASVICSSGSFEVTP